MSLALSGCPGGVVIGWSPISNPTFAKYRTLRSASADIPVAYPPQGGAVEVGDGQVGDDERRQRLRLVGYPRLTSYYRTIALNGSGAVIATSGVGSASTQFVGGLGPLVVTPDAGGTRFSWTPFTGAGTCFTYYKLAYTLDGSSPSYLEGDPYLLASGDQGQATHVSADLVSGPDVHAPPAGHPRDRYRRVPGRPVGRRDLHRSLTDCWGRALQTLRPTLQLALSADDPLVARADPSPLAPARGTKRGPADLATTLQRPCAEHERAVLVGTKYGGSSPFREARSGASCALKTRAGLL